MDGGNRPVLRVLIVDDCPDTTEMMAVLLRAWGHEVRTADDMRTAIEVVGSFCPDVALIDLALRDGMTGYEIARQVRRLPGADNALLICLTGSAEETDRRLSREAGFDHHLVKPADLVALRHLLESQPCMR